MKWSWIFLIAAALPMLVHVALGDDSPYWLYLTGFYWTPVGVMIYLLSLLYEACKYLERR